MCWLTRWPTYASALRTTSMIRLPLFGAGQLYGRAPSWRGGDLDVLDDRPDTDPDAGDPARRLEP